MNLWRHVQRHRTAWSPPFALLLVFIPVQIYVLVYLLSVARHGVAVDYLSHQWFVALWTQGGELQNGWAFEFMRVNVLFVLYLWAMSRTMHPRRDLRHRWWLLVGAWVLLAVQALWLATPDMARARFTLVRLGH